MQQGSLETSNVNTVTELVNMIECQRAYEMNSKAITTSDQMLQYLTTNLAVITPCALDSPEGSLCASLTALVAARCARAAARLMPHEQDRNARAASCRARCRRRRRAPTAPSTRQGQEMALFADLKARRVGDVLTIVLNEATTASKNAETKTSKTSAVTDTGPTDIRQVHHDQGRADPRYDALGLARLRRRGIGVRRATPSSAV